MSLSVCVRSCSDLVGIQPVVVDEEVGCPFREPEHLGETRLYLLVQESDMLPQQTQLISRQRRDNPGHTHGRTQTNTNTDTHTQMDQT